jgi:hypothetical protein
MLVWIIRKNKIEKSIFAGTDLGACAVNCNQLIYLLLFIRPER